MIRGKIKFYIWTFGKEKKTYSAMLFFVCSCYPQQFDSLLSYGHNSSFFIRLCDNGSTININSSEQAFSIISYSVVYQSVGNFFPSPVHC